MINLAEFYLKHHSSYHELQLVYFSHCDLQCFFVYLGLADGRAHADGVP